MTWGFSHPDSPLTLRCLPSQENVQGWQQAVRRFELDAHGSAEIDVYRDGVWLARTGNTGAYTDEIGKVAVRMHFYRICKAPVPG